MRAAPRTTSMSETRRNTSAAAEYFESSRGDAPARPALRFASSMCVLRNQAGMQEVGEHPHDRTVCHLARVLSDALPYRPRITASRFRFHWKFCRGAMRRSACRACVVLRPCALLYAMVHCTITHFSEGFASLRDLFEGSAHQHARVLAMFHFFCDQILTLHPHRARAGIHRSHVRDAEMRGPPRFTAGPARHARTAQRPRPRTIRTEGPVPG